MSELMVGFLFGVVVLPAALGTIQIINFLKESGLLKKKVEKK